jgi:putative ABC transport system substrate-binding protein
MRRRDFITLLTGTMAAWSLTARAQQAAPPLVGFVHSGFATDQPQNAAAFRKGLSETGYVEGQNVAVEYHWLEGQYDRVPAVMADLVRRRVTVIAVPSGNTISLAAKAATVTIPIVFAVGEDPVKLGLVPSLARPGGNLTGINFFVQELTAKQLALLQELVPTAVRVVVLLNPANGGGATILRDVREAARVIGLDIHVVNAGTSNEIDAAFAALARERSDAVFVAPDAFYAARRVQITSLAARERIPAVYWNREFAEAGGLMSYGTDFVETFHQAGAYVGRILKGAKPADLPVVQPTKFEFVINRQTARLLGIEVSPKLLAIADEVIE